MHFTRIYEFLVLEISPFYYIPLFCFILFIKLLADLITGSTVVLICCKSDCQILRETLIFGPSQPGNP